jgi:hypothetical protein
VVQGVKNTLLYFERHRDQLFMDAGAAAAGSTRTDANE